jgi:UDP-N-acetylmuramate--alanine ligase
MAEAPQDAGSQDSPAIQEARHVHLVGIGGSGMAALASLLLRMGKHVSGSDVDAESQTARRLRGMGATVSHGHRAEYVGTAEYVVRSSAVGRDNPEVVEAERRGLPTRKLAEAVGELMHGRQGVAVAGTHGKTTTTSLVTWLLDKAGLDPLALIGADTPAFPFGARLGEGPMIVEADEYDRRFLAYWPEVVVVTSVEPDHLDYYRDLDEIRRAFQELVERVPAHGRLIACADEPGAASLSSGHAARETYGFAPEADWRISDYAQQPGAGSRFRVEVAGRGWDVAWSLVGDHNARNAVAALAVADSFGIGLRSSLAALAEFTPPKRRFETKGCSKGVQVVDDYAHHPTEVGTTLHAARASTRGSVWVVFQPHTTNRTASLLDEFGRAFDAAHHALILPIYQPSGRETSPREVTSADLVRQVRGNGHPDARPVASFDEARTLLKREVRRGDLVLTMGAGDVTLLADALVKDFEA